jgi:putative ABC transport system substrate-binding protein
VELLKEADPPVTRAAVVYSPDPTGPGAAENEYVPFIREAAAALGIELSLIEFHSAIELERAVEAFAIRPNGGLIVLPGTVTFTHDNQDLLRKLAVRHGSLWCIGIILFRRGAV